MNSSFNFPLRFEKMQKKGPGASYLTIGIEE